MTQEDKNLLLRDLCARLPFQVICKITYTDVYEDGSIKKTRRDTYLTCDYLDDYIEGNAECKPYLRPMSSMTEEERKEFIKYAGYEIEESVNGRHYEYYLKDFCGTPNNPSVNADSVDWLNKNMFDFRGLIPNDLALEAPEGMYVHETKLEFQTTHPEVDSDAVNESGSRIGVGCKIRSKTNPNIILSIISDDCHGDKFECSNGSVLSLKQINKCYDLYIEENKGTIVIN